MYLHVSTTRGNQEKNACWNTSRDSSIIVQAAVYITYDD